MEWVPEGAIVVYPTDVVQQLFQHRNVGSTRKQMSRYDCDAVHGYWVDEVHWVLENRDPKRSGYSRERNQPVRKQADRRK